MAKQLFKLFFIFFLASSVLAGGDDRDNELVESLDAISNSPCSDAEGAVPCADLVVSSDEDALQMGLTDEELETELAAYQAKLKEKRAMAAQQLADEQAVLDEIAAFEAELEKQRLADNLAAYQAKIDAERALAAKNLAEFNARKAAEQAVLDEIAAFEAELADQALLDKIAAFEAELAKQQLADELAAYQAKLKEKRAKAAAKVAAEQAILDEIAEFEAQLAAEAALEKELADFEAELAASLELDKQRAAELAAKLAAEKAAFEAYHSCKARLNLSDANIAKFKAAIAAGNLYNVGPQVSAGTDFSPNRWDSFFVCKEPS